MANCLGLFIQKNLIKYAKVSKDRDTFKVESFGVKFYDNLNEAIHQIIEETFSYRTPISVNLSEEMYNHFNMFALLNKKDLQKAIKTEFESYCTDKGYNPNIFETRYAIVENIEDKEKLKVIHISANKIELNKRIDQLDGFHLVNVSPVSMAISNMTAFSPKENSIIVNIEDKTTITTIIDQKIYDVKIIDQGSEEFLNKINIKENSYAKSYEICKETTIYTSEGRDLTSDVQENYLEDIMPTLYEIVGQVRKIINQNMQRFDNLYITGTAALINNVDLYFQEYLDNIKCQILKPKFIMKTPEINIKDYIEVNSAISIALMGLDEGISGMNFKKTSFMDSLPEWMKIEIGPSKKAKDFNSQKNKFFSNDLNIPLDKIEISMVRGTVAILLLLIIYCIFTILITKQIDQKNKEAQELISNTGSQIALVDADNEKIKSKINNYTTMIKNLEEINNQITDRNKIRDAIPNLLNQLMYIMPEDVQITSIQNTTDNKIVINAQSTHYEQLGFLKANIQLEKILLNVISTTGQKENNIVSIRIEGELP